MGFFDKLDKDFNKIYNDQFASQDLAHSKELSEVYFDHNLKKHSADPYKFYLEGIFLGVTDRTAAHPYLVKVIESKPSFYNKLLGFQGGKINWERDSSFILENYLKSNWFHPSLDAYKNEKEDLANSKELYINCKIDFFEYFIKRLKVYDTIQQSDHMRHYEGIKRDKYIQLLRDKLRLILR